MGFVAPRYVGSSLTRARTRVPCIGRRILNHCATREVPGLNPLMYLKCLARGIQQVLNVCLSFFLLAL